MKRLTTELLKRLEFTPDQIVWIEKHGLIGLPLSTAAERMGWLNKYEWSVTISLPEFTETELKCYFAIVGRTPRERSDFVVAIMKTKDAEN